jgi:hypothetical protein
MLVFNKALEAARTGGDAFRDAVAGEIVAQQFALFDDTSALCPEQGGFDLDVVEMGDTTETDEAYVARATIRYTEIKATGCCNVAPRIRRSIEATYTIAKRDGSVRVTYGECTGPVTLENDFA